jgi:hypothetical protein
MSIMENENEINNNEIQYHEISMAIMAIMA